MDSSSPSALLRILIYMKYMSCPIFYSLFHPQRLLTMITTSTRMSSPMGFRHYSRADILYCGWLTTPRATGLPPTLPRVFKHSPWRVNARNNLSKGETNPSHHTATQWNNGTARAPLLSRFFMSSHNNITQNTPIPGYPDIKYPPKTSLTLKSSAESMSINPDIQE